MIETSRRGFLLGLGACLAAPAIVKIEHIMPVRNRLLVPEWYAGEIRGMVFHWDGNPRTIQWEELEPNMAAHGLDTKRPPRVIRAPALGENMGIMLPRKV